jgi:hypothetical protein
LCGGHHCRRIPLQLDSECALLRGEQARVDEATDRFSANFLVLEAIREAL